MEISPYLRQLGRRGWALISVRLLWPDELVTQRQLHQPENTSNHSWTLQSTIADDSLTTKLCAFFTSNSLWSLQLSYSQTACLSFMSRSHNGFNNCVMLAESIEWLLTLERRDSGDSSMWSSSELSISSNIPVIFPARLGCMFWMRGKRRSPAMERQRAWESPQTQSSWSSKCQMNTVMVCYPASASVPVVGRQPTWMQSEAPDLERVQQAGGVAIKMKPGQSDQLLIYKVITCSWNQKKS